MHSAAVLMTVKADTDHAHVATHTRNKKREEETMARDEDANHPGTAAGGILHNDTQQQGAQSHAYGLHACGALGLGLRRSTHKGDRARRNRRDETEKRSAMEHDAQRSTVD